MHYTICMYDNVLFRQMWSAVFFEIVKCRTIMQAYYRAMNEAHQ